MKTTWDIILLAGGPVAIAQEARRRGVRLTPSSVYKWSSSSDLGIPEKHWRIVRDMSGGAVTAETLHAANEAQRRQRQAA